MWQARAIIYWLDSCEGLLGWTPSSLPISTPISLLNQVISPPTMPPHSVISVKKGHLVAPWRGGNSCNLFKARDSFDVKIFLLLSHAKTLVGSSK